MDPNTSEIDELTGLYNDVYLNEKLRSATEKSNRFNKPYSMVRFDIDNFKDINDKYGFDFGNQLIYQLGQYLNNCTRGTDIVFRSKAEEFIVLLPESSLEDANIFAERMRKSIEEFGDFGAADKKVNITVSIGIVTYNRKQAMDAGQLLELLDASVYQAKQDGRNRIVPYTSILPPQDDYI